MATETLKKLEKLGFKNASRIVKEKLELKRKMMIAYEHFRYVTQERIDAFNQALRAESMQENKQYYQYKVLGFIPLEAYSEVPPVDVLDKVEQAIEKGCFDTFEIAKIQDVKEVKDPIVFGRINGCTDRFFIAQWDDDVKIEDILKESEG